MKTKGFLSQWAIPFLLIGFGFALRLLPHPANITPIGAIALFSGLYLPKRLALVVPVGAMLVSDALIGFYTWQIMLSVYMSFSFISILGLWLRNHKTFGMTIVSALAGSLTFFLITNAAVWAFSTMYPHTFPGLLQSYLMGLPFLRNMVIGDMGYVALLIGGYETILFAIKKNVFSQSTQYT